nr:hypothetical protein [uncultured Carboxylicivirga sp.]
MNSQKSDGRRKPAYKIEINTSTGQPAGLEKTRKIIQTELDKEIQFNKLCSKIKLEDFRQKRSEKQNLDRRAKRIK